MNKAPIDSITIASEIVGVTARLLHPSFPSDLAKLPVRENNGSSVAPRSQGCGAPD